MANDMIVRGPVEAERKGGYLRCVGIAVREAGRRDSGVVMSNLFSKVGGS